MDNTLKKIYQAGLKFLVPLDPGEAYKLIVEEAMKLVKADFGSILLNRRGELERVYASSAIFYKIKPRKRGFMYRVYKTRQPLILTRDNIVSIHPEISQTQVLSDLIVPLSYRNKSIGVLTIMSSQPNYFTQEDLNVLRLFGQFASLAIRKTQLYDETKNALESRDLFISMAAHELRTPLTTINGYVQLLYSKLSGANTAEARWIEELSWETQRLTQLVNELLEIERIKTGQLKYVWKECHLKEVIRRALNDFRFTYPEYKVVLVDQIKDSNDIVVGDFDKLIQAIINLLDNAAKYSSPGSEITVALKSKLPYIVLSIKDQGHGIAKKDLSAVFEKFYRADTTNREGMGVGLFLVKNIIKQHHGDIDIHSKEGKGTKVEIKLPQTKHG